MSEAIRNEVATLRRESSMDHWWPRLQNVDINKPQTIRLEITDVQTYQEGLKLPLPDEKELRDAVRQVGGPPAFLRTDVTSRKHKMKGSSRVEDIENVVANVAGVVEQHHLSMGMPMPESFYVREWLDLYHEYKTFADGATSIAAEFRTFILDGEFHGSGFYWPEESIWGHSATKDNWRELHQEVKGTVDAHLDAGTDEYFAGLVAEEFDQGYWSVDFALAYLEEFDAHEWYCIDMARGEMSWHPDGIEQAVPDPRERNFTQQERVGK